MLKMHRKLAKTSKFYKLIYNSASNKRINSFDREEGDKPGTTHSHQSPPKKSIHGWGVPIIGCIIISLTLWYLIFWFFTNALSIVESNNLLKVYPETNKID